MNEIPAHRQLGMNVRRCFCGYCLKDLDQVRPMGAYNSIRTCRVCGNENYGGGYEVCGKCWNPLNNPIVRQLRDDEKVPGLSMCPECQIMANVAKRRVEAGGVFFYCKKCEAVRVADCSSELAIRTRNLLNVRPPEVCGIQVESCPVCKPLGPGMTPVR